MATFQQVFHRGRSYKVDFDLLDNNYGWAPHWRRGEVGGDGAGSVDLWYADEQTIREKFWLPEAGDVVIDVGSSIGSCLPALIWGARVYAVDPREDSQELIQAISDANQINPDQLIHVNGALGEVEDGYPPDIWAAVEAYRGGASTPRDATFTTLDKLVADYQIPKVDWIKIDVEGCELSVLRGGVDTLRNSQPTVIVEDHTDLFAWVRPMRIRDQWQDLLRDLKYEMIPELYVESPGSIDRYFWCCRPCA